MHSRIHHQLTIRADSKESISVLSAEHTLNHLLFMAPAETDTIILTSQVANTTLHG